VPRPSKIAIIRFFQQSSAAADLQENRRDAPPQTITTDNHPSKEAKEEPRKLEYISHTDFKKTFFVQCNPSEEAEEGILYF